ncbi:hypothetical protein ACHAXS_002475 [Conticribra weissflogii]
MTFPTTTPQCPLGVLIVGGGLSGLTVAWLLSQHSSQCESLAWHLLEAQDQLGGRLQNDPFGYGIDMGGAWVWLGYQPYMKSLLSKLNLEGTIPQLEKSLNDGRVRIIGGAAKIISSLESSLDKSKITLSATVVSCTRLKRHKNVMKVQFRWSCPGADCADNFVALDQHQDVVYAKQLVWTAPPRKSMAPTILWDPPLSDSKIREQANSNTWMASVTKVSFIYDVIHWDEDWLMTLKFNMYKGRQSGRMEVFDIYDACTFPLSLSQKSRRKNDRVDGVAAFTIFACLSLDSLSLRKSDIATRIMSQLASIAPLSKSHDDEANSSSWMTNYSRSVVKIWPLVDSINDNPKTMTVGSHPEPRTALATPEWPLDGESIVEGDSETKSEQFMIYFAGTESDLRSPGLMEGAVSAAHRVVKELQRSRGDSGV